MLYACFNFTNEYYELKEIRADFNDRYKGLDEVSATVWVSLLRGWNNKQLKLVRTRHYFHPISHPLMESVKFARIKPLDSIKGKNLRKNRRFQEKTNSTLQGLNKKSDLIAVNWSIFTTKLVKSKLWENFQCYQYKLTLVL